MSHLAVLVDPVPVEDLLEELLAGIGPYSKGTELLERLGRDALVDFSESQSTRHGGDLLFCENTMMLIGESEKNCFLYHAAADVNPYSADCLECPQ